MINPQRLTLLLDAVAMLAFERVGDFPPGILGEILAGNADRFPDRESVMAALSFYVHEAEPYNDDPSRKRLCLNCGAVLIILMEPLDGCPACGDRTHSHADLNAMVAPEMTAYELRVMSIYAENYARMSSLPAMRVMRTILTRLEAQGVEATMSPDVRNLPAASPEE